MIQSNFFIYNMKCCYELERSVDWFLNSRKFKKKSLERQICMLKNELHLRNAKKYNRKALKCLS